MHNSMSHIQIKCVIHVVVVIVAAIAAAAGDGGFIYKSHGAISMF